MGRVTLHHPSLPRVRRTDSHCVKSPFNSTLRAEGALTRNRRWLPRTVPTSNAATDVAGVGSATEDADVDATFSIERLLRDAIRRASDTKRPPGYPCVRSTG